jgi:hypothetical protein
MKKEMGANTAAIRIKRGASIRPPMFHSMPVEMSNHEKRIKGIKGR